MDVSKKNLYIPLRISFGSLILYYVLLHDISGPLGGLAFFFIGWALPLVFVIFLSIFLSNWLSQKFNLNRIMFLFGFIVLAFFSSLFVDKNIYRLHTTGGDEGCMCMYFSYGGGRLGDEYRMSKIGNGKFFQYATEAFIKGFHLGL